ncbi:AAA family ATPase [Gryllotalpicola kribbensis]|uniref:AAA family ATPase n=1 Tax=Gryllotalpicola kribbensis TaxID=993084 RepID=A0ABP8ARV5_9MICO
MQSIIAKVDHLSNGVPMLRATNGVLFVGDSEVTNLGLQVGDVVLCDNDGEWTIGVEADWEPRINVGSVTHVTDTQALIRSGLEIHMRTIPDGIEIQSGDTVAYDERPELLEVVTTERVRASLLGEDGFDVTTVRRLPNADLEWDQFAGSPDIVREAKDIVAVHTDLEARRRLSALGVDPVRGILFEGPPGTGKTFLAQIMAAKSGAMLYLVTTASLGGRLVSESEQRLESIYEDAARQDLSIIFIDEIEVLTRERGSEHDQGSRLVNVFLTNMDGMASHDNVITIGATNRVHDIDRALRRPGRFDREVSFRLPDSADRYSILTARRRVTTGGLDYAGVADATDGWTAADLEAIWKHAGELTVIAGRSAIRNDHFLMGFERARDARANRLNGTR